MAQTITVTETSACFPPLAPHVRRLEAWDPVYGTVNGLFFDRPPPSELMPEMVSSTEALQEITGSAFAVHPADWD